MPEMRRDRGQTVINPSGAKVGEAIDGLQRIPHHRICERQGQWQAHIRRRDRKDLSVEGTTLPVFTTMHADSENEAIRIAKEAIDTRKISAAKS